MPATLPASRPRWRGRSQLLLVLLDVVEPDDDVEGAGVDDPPELDESLELDEVAVDAELDELSELDDELELDSLDDDPADAVRDDEPRLSVL